MADTKTTALTAATSWASGDLLYMVRDPAGTPVSRKITVDNILQNLVCAANTSLIKSASGYSLTGSNAQSMIDLAGTLNTTGSPAIIKVAMSNAASGATTKFISLLAGASGTTEVFSVDKAGKITGASDATFGADAVNISASTGHLRIYNAGALGWTAAGSASTAIDTILLRDAANTLALRNAANAQAFNIYGTYTSGSVYERGFMRWVSNVLEIGTEHVGASARDLVLKYNNVETARVTNVQLSVTGSVVASSYVRGSYLRLGAADHLHMYTAGNGVVTLYNTAENDFDRLQFGGTSNLFPSWKRSSAILQARLADDSDFAPLQGQLRSHANATSETPTATHTLRLFDAAGTEYRVLAIAV